ncbi:MAG: nuclear transport factor 2 family protein [Planctomycetota bacterium]
MSDPNPLAEFIESVRTVFEHRDNSVSEKRHESENVDRIQAIYRAAKEGEIGQFKKHFDDDVVILIVGAPGIRFKRAASGVDSAVALVAGNFSMLEYQFPDLVSIVAQGDIVYLRGRETGRFKGADSDYQLNWVQEYTFKNGKVISFVQFLDDAELLPPLP